VVFGAADTGFHTKQPADIYYLADLRGKVNPNNRFEHLFKAVIFLTGLKRKLTAF